MALTAGEVRADRRLQSARVHGAARRLRPAQPSVRLAAELLMLLQCGEWPLWVDDRIFHSAQPRCHLEPFVLAQGEARLRVERDETLSDGRALEGSNAPWGSCTVEGDRVRAHIPDDMWAAEAVLRIAWQTATHRQGGFLVHGCGVAFGDRAVTAIGASGAGKSTLAMLCSGAPAQALVLTDEISQLFPDGWSGGTPFRSSLGKVGSPLRVRLATLLLLEKGDHEAVAPVPAEEAAPAILSQLYRTATDEVRQAELVRRALLLIERVGVYRLTFRKDPAVGSFLRDWVKGRAAA
jgi:hypothetical protein